MCVLPCQSLRRSRIIHKVRLRHLRRALFKQPARLRELPISEMDERQIECREPAVGHELDETMTKRECLPLETEVGFKRHGWARGLSVRRLRAGENRIRTFGPALAPFGIGIFEMPITPQRISQLLREAGFKT